MIRALGLRDGKPIVLLGLEPENLKRLADNEPIRVNLSRLDPTSGHLTGLPDMEVVIFSTEATSSEDLQLLFKKAMEA